MLQTNFFQKRFLQICISIGALVPFGAGIAGVFTPDWLEFNLSPNPNSDSHFRYLSGLLLAIGLGFWSCVPRIEQKSARILTLTAIVFTGGLCRLWAFIESGNFSFVIGFALMMELIITPALFFWQQKLAHALSLAIDIK